MVTRGEPHDFFVRLDDTMKQVTTLLIFCIVESFLLLEAADKKPQLELTLFFTGYVQGNFEPCGCKSGPYGGLARRAGYISDYQKSSGGSSIQADAGNYFQLIGPYSDVVNRLMLDSLEVFPVQVLNLGTEDLMFWSKLSEAPLARTQVISTNLVRSNASLPSPKPYAVVQIPADSGKLGTPLKIGFLGLSDPARVKPRSGFRGRDPFEVLAEVVPELSGKVDLIVVLADLPRKVGIEIARRHSEVGAVLVAERGSRVEEAERVNNAIIASSVDRGRYLGKLILNLEQGGKVVGWDSEYVALKGGMTEDPVWLRRQARVAKHLYGSPNAAD